MQASIQKVVHKAGFAKSHLGLGRMHVYIHAKRIHFQKQHEGRMPAMEEHVRIGLANGMRNHAITHQATIDVEILLVRLRTRRRGQTDPSVQAHAGTFLTDAHAVAEEFRAKHLGYPLRCIRLIS